MNVTNDPDHKHCSECLEHWANIKRARAHFSREIEFDRKLDGRSQQILNYLEQTTQAMDDDAADKEVDNIMAESPTDEKHVRFSDNVQFSDQDIERNLENIIADN